MACRSQDSFPLWPPGFGGKVNTFLPIGKVDLKK